MTTTITDTISMTLSADERFTAGISDEEPYTYLCLRNKDSEIRLDLDIDDVRFLRDYLSQRLEVLDGK